MAPRLKSAGLRPPDISGSIANPDVAMRHTLAARARRCLDLHEEIKIHTAHLEALTKAAAPEMVEQSGIGFDTTAEMLITAGDNTDRIRSEAAFAKLCGACPIPAGSGRAERPTPPQPGREPSSQRCPLSRRHRPLRWHPPTIAYVERRTAEVPGVKCPANRGHRRGSVRIHKQTLTRWPHTFRDPGKKPTTRPPDQPRHPPRRRLWP